jgi:hypothetical protein
MTRQTTGPKIDCYISPNDGKLNTLVVSATNDVLAIPGTGTWKRTEVRNVVPWSYRIALWPTNHTDVAAKHWDSNDWIFVGLKWIPAILFMSICVSLSTITPIGILSLTRL